MATNKKKMFARTQDEEDYVCLRECFADSVSLLGFNEWPVAKRNGVSMERDSFVLPNKPLFESLLYFLFLELDKKKTETELRDCWPVVDRKQELQFRRISFEFLRSLPEDEIHLPQNLASLLLSPNGRKFYSFGVHLTNYVMTVRIRKTAGPNRHLLSMPRDLRSKEELDSISKTFEMGMTMHLKNYFTTEDEKRVTYDTFTKAVSDQVELYYELLAKIEEKKKSICSKEETLAKQRLKCVESNQLENVVSKRTIDVIDSWRTVDDVCERSKEPIESLNYLTTGNYEKYKMDGSMLSVAVPPSLIGEERNDPKGDSKRLDANGNVRLEHLVMTFNEALKLYDSKLRNDFGCDERNLESLTEHRDRRSELMIPIRSLQSKLIPLAAAMKSSSESLFQEAVSQLDSGTMLNSEMSSLPTNSPECSGHVLPLTPAFDLRESDN